MTAISFDLRPDDHDHANPVSHDLPAEVRDVICACQDVRCGLPPGS